MIGGLVKACFYYSIPSHVLFEKFQSSNDRSYNHSYHHVNPNNIIMNKNKNNIILNKKISKLTCLDFD
jgi:hypothetical protein